MKLKLYSESVTRRVMFEIEDGPLLDLRYKSGNRKVAREGRAVRIIGAKHSGDSFYWEVKVKAIRKDGEYADRAAISLTQYSGRKGWDSDECKALVAMAESLA